MSLVPREVVIEFAAVPVAKTKGKRNLVCGWAMVSVEDDGCYYVDTQKTYLSQDLILDSALDFMANSRKSDDMHGERQRGTTILAWPFLDEFCQFPLPIQKRGFAIGVTFDDEIFAKFESGEYTGFSVGGVATAKLLPPGVCPECEKAYGDCKCSRSDHQRVAKSAELGGHPHKYVSFKMDWISAVTRPAQTGAKSLLVAKRYTPISPTLTITEPAMDPTLLTAALTVAKKRLDDIGTLTGAQFDVFKGMTEDGQARFLAMSHGERDEAVQKAQSADPVEVEYMGQAVRKSAGPAVIAALKAAKARDEVHAQEVEVHKAQVYKVRVASDIPHLALDETAGVELLVAVDTIKNAEIRGKVVTALKAFSNHNGGAGHPKGVNGGGIGQVRKNADGSVLSAGSVYIAAVHKFAAEKQISPAAAYSAFPDSSPEAKLMLVEYEAEKADGNPAVR